VQASARSDPPHSESRHDRSARVRAYWRENLRLIVILSLIWFAAGFLHPPFARALNGVTILTGFPLGYWLASQFSLTVFVILIFVYALIMNRVIDPKYGYHEED